LSFGKKKIKIELEDAEGGKYNLSLEGNMSKDKILRVFELMEGFNTEGAQQGKRDKYNIENQKNDNLTSLQSKIWSIIENKFPFTSFTSSDILEMYNEEYDEQIKLDVIATYLSRYHKKGKLNRSKKAKEWIYKVSRQSVSINNENDEFKQETRHQALSQYNSLHVKDLNN
jgi:predicted transcriptional regulator